MTFTPCAIYWFLQGVNVSGIWELRIKHFQKQMQKEVYVCVSAIMATGFSAILSQGKILIVCSILVIYLSVFSVPFLISLQYWHNPFQSNFSRPLYMNINTYNYLNTSFCHFSISYSCSFVTLLGCPCLLQLHLCLWAHHALLPPLPPLVPPLGTASLHGQWLQRSSNSPILVLIITLVHREILEIAFTRGLNLMTNKYFDHYL